VDVRELFGRLLYVLAGKDAYVCWTRQSKRIIVGVRAKGLEDRGMRRLEASIRTFELDRVKVSLAGIGVTRLHVSEAQGPTVRAEGAVAFLPRIRVRS
jgi:hypothetical protein